MAEKIFSKIPMATWRWLGVNNAMAEESFWQWQTPAALRYQRVQIKKL